MTKFMKVVSIAVLMAFMLGTLTLTGCTKYANEEELRALDDQQAAALYINDRMGFLILLRVQRTSAAGRDDPAFGVVFHRLVELLP